MSPREQLGDALAHRWLASVSPFSRELRDTGGTHLGNPVFELDYRWEGETIAIKVYRYTPLNSEASKLAFLPTWGD